MRPETCAALRQRVIVKARPLIAEMMVWREVVVSAKNGAAAAWPDTEAVADNAELRTEWARQAQACGFGITDRVVTSRLKIDLYQVVSVRFADLDALLAFLGSPWAETGRVADALITRFPALRDAALIRALLGLDLLDLSILTGLCDWRDARSADELAGLMLREISVPDMGTKWMERNAGLILRVFATLGWTVSDTGSLEERLGLDDPDKSFVHVRICPSDAQKSGLWPQFGVPSSLFTSFSFAPKKVLILENKTTFRRVDVEPGCVAIWGSGHAIVAMAKRMDWLRATVDVRYWGDCDGAGYLILDRLRAVLPQLVSVNMTLDVIRPNLGSAVPEPEPVPAETPRLTADERDAQAHMRAAGLRLEQEFMAQQAVNIW